jgi:hypothetical protein
VLKLTKAAYEVVLSSADAKERIEEHAHGHHDLAQDSMHLMGPLGRLLLWIHYKLPGAPLVGVFGYVIEWVLELSHLVPRLHHVLHGTRAYKLGLAAITMVLAGHYTEHLHQASST